MTVHLEPELHAALAELADSTRRSPDALALEAIRQYLELNHWQTAQIVAALDEADAGDFASDTEVRDVFDRFR